MPVKDQNFCHSRHMISTLAAFWGKVIISPFSTSSVSNPPSPVSSRQESHVDNFLPSPALIRQSESLRMSSYVTQKPCASFLTKRLDDKIVHTSKHLKGFCAQSIYAPLKCDMIYLRTCKFITLPLNEEI